MMKTNYICPIYAKWIQRFPDEGRKQRDQAERSLLAMLSEEPNSHLKDIGEAYEISLAVVTTPRLSNEQFSVLQQDLIVFYRLALLFATHPQQSARRSRKVIHHLQHQLVAILALVANDSQASMFMGMLIRGAHRVETSAGCQAGGMHPLPANELLH